MQRRVCPVAATFLSTPAKAPLGPLYLASRSCSSLNPLYETEVAAVTKGFEGTSVSRKVAEYLAKSTELDKIPVDEELLEKNFKEIRDRFLSKRKVLDENQEYNLRVYVKGKMVEYQNFATKNSQEEADEYAAALRQIEDALLETPEPTITPTCDAPFNTLEHPFVTSVAGSIAFAKVSKRLARETYFEEVTKKAFKKQARRAADAIFEMAQGDYNLTRGLLSSTALETKGRTNDPYEGTISRATRVFFGEDLSEEKVLDKIFSFTPFEKDCFPEKALGKPWDSPQVIEARIKHFSNGLITPEHEEYRGFSRLLLEAGDPETPEQREMIRKVEENREKFKALRPKLEFLLKDEHAVSRELQSLSLRNGEHGVFLTAIRSFLANNKNPTRANKLFFMQKQRDYFLKTRETIDFNVDFPSISITPANLSDDQLVAKFDEFVEKVFYNNEN